MRDGPEGGEGEVLRDVMSRLAHQIRSPLAGLKSGLQLVQHLTKPEGEVGDCFQAMLIEVARIDRVLGRLQQLASLERRPAAAVAVAEAVAEVADASRAEIQRIGVSVELVPGPDCRVAMDPSAFRLALAELVANGLAFSPRGGKVTLSWAETDDHAVHVRVDDQGPGVPEENAKRILEPFFTTSPAGAGLGLSIAAEACRLAGGELLWRHLPQGGCRFTLALPRA